MKSSTKCPAAYKKVVPESVRNSLKGKGKAVFVNGSELSNTEDLSCYGGQTVLFEVRLKSDKGFDVKPAYFTYLEVED